MDRTFGPTVWVGVRFRAISMSRFDSGESCSSGTGSKNGILCPPEPVGRLLLDEAGANRAGHRSGHAPESCDSDHLENLVLGKSHALHLLKVDCLEPRRV